MASLGGLFTGRWNEFQAKPHLTEWTPEQAALTEANYASPLRRTLGQVGQTGMADATGARQAELASMLEAQARGEGPSLAQLQLQNATEANRMAAAGSIASQRGMNPALAQRLLLNQQAAVNQQAAGQSALTALQEQMAARSLLAQALQGQRGQDLQQQGMSTQAAGVLAGANQAQNAARIQNVQGTNEVQQRLHASNQNAKIAADQINSGVAADNAEKNAGVVGGLMNAAGGVLGTMIGAAHGGRVPGEAPKAAHPKHDTVPAVLTPGETVLPPEISKNPSAARAFVSALNKLEKAPVGYGDVLKVRRAKKGGK